MIAPIQTSYKGYKMRSRTEAKWAVFFDALGLRWEYEKEGYDLGAAGYYLPDFWLPDEQCFVEVKGAELSAEDEAKVEALALGTRKPVRVVIGTPDYEARGVDYRFWTLAEMGLDAEILTMMRADPDEYGGNAKIETMVSAGGRMMASEGFVSAWFAHPPAQQIAAFEAARSARFEHGEQPRIGRQAPALPPLATHTIAALCNAPADQIGVIAGLLVNPAPLPAEQQGTVLRAGLMDGTGWARLKVPAFVYAATTALWSPGQRVLLTGRLIPHDGDFAGIMCLGNAGEEPKQMQHTILEVLRVQELPA